MVYVDRVTELRFPLEVLQPFLGSRVSNVFWQHSSSKQQQQAINKSSWGHCSSKPAFNELTSTEQMCTHGKFRALKIKQSKGHTSGPPATPNHLLAPLCCVQGMECSIL